MRYLVQDVAFAANKLACTPGRKTTRRIEEPTRLGPSSGPVSDTAQIFAATHNDAVHQYGSDSGGYFAFRPVPGDGGPVGVYTGGPFPRDTVVTRLSWGRIDPETAQRLLEGDGWTEVA